MSRNEEASAATAALETHDGGYDCENFETYVSSVEDDDTPPRLPRRAPTRSSRMHVLELDVERDAAAAVLLRATEANDVLWVLATLEHVRRLKEELVVDVVKLSGAVHAASRHGYDAILVNLLSVDDTSADLVNHALPSGQTPLYFACAAGHVTTARMLIELGATWQEHEDAWYTSRKNNARECMLFSSRSPFHAACLHGHLPVFTLLENSFNCEWTSDEASIFLRLACISRSVAMVKKFSGAVDLNQPLKSLQNDGDDAISPLEMALSVKALDVAAFLIGAGAAFTSAVLSNYPQESSELLCRYIRPRKQERQGTEEIYDVWWDGLHLHELDISTLMDFYDKPLGIIDASRNQIKALPPAIPWRLEHVEVLNLSLNELEHLSWPCAAYGTLNTSVALRCCLKEVDLSKNMLTSVPLVLFMLPSLEVLNLSYNKLSTLVSEDGGQSRDTAVSDAASKAPWRCIALRTLDLSHNELEWLPESLSAAIALDKFIVSNNHLRKFIPSWPSPMSQLNLSYNWLTSSPVISSNTWDTTLVTVNLAGNRLVEVHVSIFQLEYLQHLDLSFNCITSLPAAEQWNVPSLASLDLSHNRLRSMPSVSATPAAILEFPSCLQSRLSKLNLGFNRLTTVPLSVCRLKSLEELDISGNVALKELPYEISNLQSLWSLELNGLTLRNLPRSLGIAHTRSILEYLGEQYTDATPCHHLKVIVVGNKGHGKTSLAYALQRKKPPADLNFGKVEIMSWQMRKGSKTALEVSLWDLPGDSETANLAQCFMSANALYIVVCNLLTLSSGNTGLDDWLRNIQSGAPGSNVIIVGTHLDAIKDGERQAAEGRLRTAVNDLCLAQGEADDVFIRSCYPDHLNRNEITVVACSEKDSRLMQATMKTLRERMLSVAFDMKVAGQKRLLIGRKVPRAYIRFQEAVKKEAAARNNELFLTTREFQELVLMQGDVSNVDLALVAQYLHETGCILHFPNHLRGLNELYFINPPLLYDMLSKILMSTAGPVLPIEEAELLFRTDDSVTLAMFQRYLELMEKFEIALCMDHSERLLVPSKLPAKPAIEDEDGSSSERRAVVRVYTLAYVPVGFWSRVIVRLLNGLHRVYRTGSTFGSGSKRQSLADGFLVSTKRKVIYWNSGFRFDDSSTGCSFTAESVKGSPNDVCLEVRSETGEYGAMGFLVDQVSAVLQEWYPELLQECGPRRHHEPCIIQAACPLCPQLRGSQHSQCAQVTMFSMEQCVTALIQRLKGIVCPNHPDVPVPLGLLVPDLLMADLPLRCKLIPEMVRPDKEAKPLGKGGEAAVYFGHYGKTLVAYKICYGVPLPSSLPSRPSSACTFDSGIDSQNQVSSCTYNSLELDIRAKTSMAAIAGIRQEAVMLLRLQHPCLVKMVGVSLWVGEEFAPCTALELAPLGDLRSVLDNAMAQPSTRHNKPGRQQQSQCRRPPLGRALTYRILCQVANALRYLHAAGIVYRDLKTDNVLVWNLSAFGDGDSSCSGDQGILPPVVNVKLSDYGLSRVITSQGTVGNEGTPAYQAPEVMPGLAYNEKVDIFSLGMFTYELLSGQRPFENEITNSSIRAAIRKGSRPSLNEAPHRVFVDMHCLTQLLPQLWSADQRSRPSAMDIVSQVHTLTFYGLMHCLPQLPVKQPDQPPYLRWPSAAHYFCDARRDELWLWEGADDARRFHMVDPDLGVFTTGCYGLKLPGGAVVCTLIVDKQIWLGLQNGVLEIFQSLADDAPSTFNLEGRPTFLFHYKATQLQLSAILPAAAFQERVFCGLQSGAVCVFHRSIDDVTKWVCAGRIRLSRRSTANLADGHFAAADHASTNLAASGTSGDDTPKQQSVDNEPASCVCEVTAEDGCSELWIGFGGGVAVIGDLARVTCGNLVDYIPLRRTTAALLSGTEMANLCHRGSSVFAMFLNDRKVYQLSSKLRVIEYVFSVSSFTRVGSLIASQQSPESTELLETGEKASLAERSRLNISASFRKRQKPGTSAGVGGSKRESAPSENISKSICVKGSSTVSSVVAVKDTLWLGMSSGDILIVSINNECGHSFRYKYGEIVAILHPPKGETLNSPVFFASASQKRILALYTSGAETASCQAAKLCSWEPLSTATIISLSDWWPHMVGR